ncbi:MAG: hypothetical protein ACKOBI_03390, partial [Bacteroidota bacterium]
MLQGRNASIHKLCIGDDIGIDIVVFAVTNGCEIKSKARRSGNHEPHVEEEPVEDGRVKIKPSGAHLLLTAEIGGIDQECGAQRRVYVGRPNKGKISGVVIDRKG